MSFPHIGVVDVPANGHRRGEIEGRALHRLGRAGDQPVLIRQICTLRSPQQNQDRALSSYQIDSAREDAICGGYYRARAPDSVPGCLGTNPSPPAT